MSSYYEIPTPDGRRYKVYYAEGQDKAECLKDSVQGKWSEYCENNWLSDNHEAIDAPEKKVKRFLDSCAYFMQRSDTEGIETDYQREKRGMYEISTSSLPASYAAAQYGGNVNKTADDKQAVSIQLDKTDKSDKLKKTRGKKAAVKHRMSKFDIIRKIKQEHPHCFITGAVVDTACVFTYNGKRYRISDEVQAYQGVQTKYGILYDMDRIVIVKTQDGTSYYTDAMEEIAPHLIKEMT